LPPQIALARFRAIAAAEIRELAQICDDILLTMSAE